MKSPRHKENSPILEKLPELLKSKTPRPLIKPISYSKSSKHQSEIFPTRKNINIQLRNASPKEFQSLLFDNLDLKFSEDFKKLNMYFSEASINKSLLNDCTFEEINHGAPAGRKDARLLIE